MEKDGKYRILIFVPENRYINSTEEELILYLEKRFDIFLYGPGYVENDDIVNDAHEVYSKYGPFDVAILHQYFIFNSLRAASKSVFFPFDVHTFCDKFPDFPQNFNKLPCVKIAMLLRMDYYILSDQDIQLLENFPGYYLSWPSVFVPLKRTLDRLEDENFSDITDNYHHFAVRHHQQIIPYVHTVNDQLILPISEKKTKHMIAVPGHPYSRRKAAIDSLKKNNIAVKKQSALISLVSKMMVVLFKKNLTSYSWGIDYLHKTFRKKIQSSLICFTDGSRLNWPLRKYFEIPAFASLLVCEPFNECENLGFLENENFVQATPQTLPQVVSKVTAETDWAYDMIQKLQNMVREKHSASARIDQLSAVIKAILDNSYKGAHWSQGRFIIE